MDKIYIVYGTSGFRDDKVEWNVTAFVSESKAVALRAKLDALELEYWAEMSECDCDDDCTTEVYLRYNERFRKFGSHCCHLEQSIYDVIETKFDNTP